MLSENGRFVQTLVIGVGKCFKNIFGDVIVIVGIYIDIIAAAEVVAIFVHVQINLWHPIIYSISIAYIHIHVAICIIHSIADITVHICTQVVASIWGIDIHCGRWSHSQDCIRWIQLSVVVVVVVVVVVIVIVIVDTCIVYI